MSRAQKRPPKLESRAHEAPPAPPPTLEELLERAKIAGPGGSGPGPSELRRTLERLVRGDRRTLGEIAPIDGLMVDGAWKAVDETFGATAEVAVIDGARTLAAIRAARAHVEKVATSGARIAIATSAPASLLTLHLAFARLARLRGGAVVDLADFGPIRADGRAGRRLRWFGGVAVVSDGDGLCATRDGEAAREWLFAIPRPALVIADGPFAEVAWESGIDVVACAGLDRLGLAVAAARRGAGIVVPMRTDLAARGYRMLEEIVAGEEADPPARGSGSEAGL